MPNYAKQLAKLIEKKLDGRTHQWLADQSGVSRSVLSRTIAGDSLPSLENFVRIAHSLGLTANDLINPTFNLSNSQADSNEPDGVLTREYLKDLLDTIRELQSENERLRKEIGIQRLNSPYSDTRWEINRALDAYGPVAEYLTAYMLYRDERFWNMLEEHLEKHPKDEKIRVKLEGAGDRHTK